MDSTAALAEQSSRVDGIVAPRAFAFETPQFTAKGGGVGLGGLADRRIDDAAAAGDERRERLARAYVLQRVETTYKSYCIRPRRRRASSTITSRDHHVPLSSVPAPSRSLARRTRSTWSARNIAFTSAYSDRSVVRATSRDSPVFNRFTARPSAATSTSSSVVSVVTAVVDDAARRVDARLFVDMCHEI